MSNKTMLGDASGRGAVDGFRVTCPAMQHPYTEAEIDAVVKVMREACGQTQGKYMVEFEQAFCAFTGAKHAFAVNNCTSALKMAAIFCHIQPGDEVIIPAYTFCASAIPFGDLGAKIVWADINPDTWTIDPDDIERKITDRTKGIVVLEDEMRACCDHLYMMTDDGTYGEKGFTTVKLKELLEKAKAEGQQYDHCICIGPLPMMKFVCQITKEYGVATMVDMNCIMIDGSGMCGGCRLTVDGKMKFTCVDGPEFDGHLVDFDEAIARSKIYEAQEQKVFERRHHYCNLQAMADAEEAAQKKEEK